MLWTAIVELFTRTIPQERISAATQPMNGMMAAASLAAASMPRNYDILGLWDILVSLNRFGESTSYWSWLSSFTLEMAQWNHRTFPQRDDSSVACMCVWCTGPDEDDRCACCWIEATQSTNMVIRCWYHVQHWPELQSRQFGVVGLNSGYDAKQIPVKWLYNQYKRRSLDTRWLFIP